jgi:hypothetical protein
MNNLEIYTAINAITESLKALRLSAFEKKQAIKKLALLKKELIAIIV